jgi:Na+/citrate or Na+/malate symporter
MSINENLGHSILARAMCGKSLAMALIIKSFLVYIRLMSEYSMNAVRTFYLTSAALGTRYSWCHSLSLTIASLVRLVVVVNELATRGLECD